MAEKMRVPSLFDAHILSVAAAGSLKKLNPAALVRNPVIFVTEVVAALVTVLFFDELLSGKTPWFAGQIALWLWITVLFANFAGAGGEGRGKAQAAPLGRARKETMAKRLADPAGRKYETVSAHDLRPGDIVLVEAREVIPGDGDVIEGIASVNESAITGE